MGRSEKLRAGLDSGCSPNPAIGYGCRLNGGFLVDLALLGSSIGLPAGRVAASTACHNASRLSADVWRRSFTLPSGVGRGSIPAAAAIALIALVAACSPPPPVQIAPVVAPLDAFGVWLFIAIAVGAFIGYGAMLAGMVAALR